MIEGTGPTSPHAAAPGGFRRVLVAVLASASVAVVVASPLALRVGEDPGGGSTTSTSTTTAVSTTTTSAPITTSTTASTTTTTVPVNVLGSTTINDGN